MRIDLVARFAHLVQAYALYRNIDVAGTTGKERETGTVFFAVAHILKRVDNAIAQTVDDEHAAVVHAHPNVLRVIYRQVEDAVVKVGDVAAIARLVVVEMKTVEA